MRYSARNKFNHCIKDVGPVLELTQGAAAIALALRHAGVKNGDTVLVPAFNCSSMVEPIFAVAAQPRSFRIKSDLAIDLDDIMTRLDNTCQSDYRSALLWFSSRYHQNTRILR